MTNGTAMSARLLHTMLRVRDLDASLHFYRDLLGMRLLRQLDFPNDRFSLVYLGYGDDREEAVLELTWNWDESAPYVMGTAYGHLGIGVADLETFCRRLDAAGVTIARTPGEMGRTGIHIAFIVDPDGYRIELIQLPYPLPSMVERMTYTR